MDDAGAMLHQAVELHQAGRLDEARQIYQTLLRIDPQNPNALNLLGMIHHQQGRPDHARELIRRAIEQAPQVAGFHNNLGAVCLADLRCTDAEAALRQAIALQPDYPEAINNLAVALMGQGRFEQAMELLAKCIELRPVYPSARHNLGNALRARRMYRQAIDCYRDAIAQQANHADAWLSLAIAQMELGELEQSEESARRAIALREDDAACHALGLILEARGRTDQAAALFEDLLTRRPGAEMVRFHLAALKGEQGYEAAPTGYVRRLFDDYCDVFDEHLVRVLKYRAPSLLIDAVTKTDGRQGMDIGDLGCGTGLCGPLLKPLARTLIGVDISPRMIHFAGQKDVYDELVVEELARFLERRPQRFDLLVAADVLIYFGDLSKVLTLAAGALREQGRIAFNLEHLDEERAEYRLQPSRRFGHAERYIRRIVEASRLELASLSAAPLRLENGQDVRGWVVVARRSAPTQAR